MYYLEDFRHKPYQWILVLIMEGVARSQVHSQIFCFKHSKIAEIFNRVFFSEYAVLLFITGINEGWICPPNAAGEYWCVFLGPATPVYTKGLPAPDNFQWDRSNFLALIWKNMVFQSLK